MATRVEELAKEAMSLPSELRAELADLIVEAWEPTTLARTVPGEDWKHRVVKSYVDVVTTITESKP